MERERIWFFRGQEEAEEEEEEEREKQREREMEMGKIHLWIISLALVSMVLLNNEISVVEAEESNSLHTTGEAVLGPPVNEYKRGCSKFKGCRDDESISRR